MKPVNTDALSKWVGHIPPDVISDMAEIAPMLARLGYDPHANPPDYTKPDPMMSLFNYSQVSSKTQPPHKLLKHQISPSISHLRNPSMYHVSYMIRPYQTEVITV